MLLAVAAAGRFLGETLIAAQQHPVSAAGLGSALASVALLVAGGGVSGTGGRTTSPWLGGLAALSGTLGTGLASWLILANRHSDAPSGSVAAFWTTVFAGCAFVLLGQVRDRDLVVVRTGGALVLAASAAGVLGNWERPSSFTLLTRFVHEQQMLALAAVVWVAAVLLIAWTAREIGWRSAMRGAGAGSAVAALALLAWAGTRGSLGELTLPSVQLYAFSSAATIVLALYVTRARGPAHAGVALTSVPALLTLLVVAETAVGAFGPRPVLLGPVGWATASLAAGGWLVVGHREASSGAPGHERARKALVGRLAAGIAVAAAFAGMFAPALSVSVRGLRTSGESFAAGFTFGGFETVGAWLVLGLAVTGLGMTLGCRVSSVRDALTAFGTLALGSVAWFAVRDTPLHTWVSWIPPEVQQDYGTEYASIEFTHVPVVWQAAAICATLIAGVALVVAAYASRSSTAGDAVAETPCAEGDSR